MTLVDKIRALANQRDMSLPQLEVELGLGNGTISRWRSSSPNTDKLQKIADYFNVSMDYLLGRETKNSGVLSLRNQKDVAKQLDNILEAIDSDDGLMFDGAAFDEETKEYLKNSISSSLITAKIMAKEKYTPKKYRKSEE